MKEFNKILLVDDSVTSRMIIKRCFTIAGYDYNHLIECEDGVSALEILKDNDDVDLIITDIHMPRMDGLTFSKKVKSQEIYQNIPILIISSIYNLDMQEKLEAIGVEFILSKPLSPSKLIEKLENTYN